MVVDMPRIYEWDETSHAAERSATRQRAWGPCKREADMRYMRKWMGDVETPLPVLKGRLTEKRREESDHRVGAWHQGQVKRRC